jgi:hypothetical protein
MRRRAVLLLVLALVACGGEEEGASPRIDALAPPEARAGDALDVLGAGLDGPSPFVSFGGATAVGPGNAEAWTDGRIRVRVPPLGAGVTTVTVTVEGRTSNPLDFLVLP